MTNTATCSSRDGNKNGDSAPNSGGDSKPKQDGSVFSRTARLAFNALRLTHTFTEGAVEGLLNVYNNLIDMLPPAVRRHSEPYVEDLSGKVAIVTGGNAGIGFATAQQLARRGAHVVLACRDKARAEAAVQAIAAAPPLPGCCGAQPPSGSSGGPPSAAPAPPLRVEAMELDLGRLASVRRFAEEWRRRDLPLHLLVCNAGVMAPLTKTLTADGMEVQFQVNFLSHWLLTQLLMGHERDRRRVAAAAAGSRQQQQQGKQKQAAGSSDATRVVVVSSVVHRAGPLQWGDFLSERSYEPYITYGLSKLAGVIAAKELQRRFDRHPEYGMHDTAVAVHPGVARTYLANNFFSTYALSSAVGTPLEPLHHMWRRFMNSAGQMILATTEFTSHRMLQACLGPSERLAGRYVAMGRVYSADKSTDDPAYAAELWDTATRLCEHKPQPSLA